VYPPRYQHSEHPITPFDRLLDDRALVPRTGKDCDMPLEPVEFAYAAFPTNTNHLLALI
jgi:hypothetical protein